MTDHAQARSQAHWPWTRFIPLLLPLGVALVVRLAAWWTLPYGGQISDEPEYLAAAAWLAEGRGFSFFKEWIWTRPPLYVVFLAAHIALFGPDNLVPIRVSQVFLSVVTVALVMVWSAMLAAPATRRHVALLAGWAMALGYGFARSEEHTSELQSRLHLVCRLLLEKKKKKNNINIKCKKQKNTKTKQQIKYT